MSTKTCERCTFWRRHTEWWTGENRCLGIGECLNPLVPHDAKGVPVDGTDAGIPRGAPVKTWATDACPLFQAG